MTGRQPGHNQVCNPLVPHQDVRPEYYPGSKEGHIPTRRAGEESGAFPSLAHRVNMQQHAELSCRGNNPTVRSSWDDEPHPIRVAGSLARGPDDCWRQSLVKMGGVSPTGGAAMARPLTIRKPSAVELPPTPFQTGIRFLSPRPLPAAPWASLTSRFPLWGDNGLTTFHRCVPVGRVAAISPVVRHLRRGICEPPEPDHVPFGPSVIASAACSELRRLSLLYLG